MDKQWNGHAVWFAFRLRDTQPDFTTEEREMLRIKLDAFSQEQGWRVNYVQIHQRAAVVFLNLPIDTAPLAAVQANVQRSGQLLSRKGHKWIRPLVICGAQSLADHRRADAYVQASSSCGIRV